MRVIDRPILRLVSVDLNAEAEITSIERGVRFRPRLSGPAQGGGDRVRIVPPGMEGSEQRIADLLEPMIGPGLGLEIVSKVNDIPKGSRLAVSTNLLGSLICDLHARHRPGKHRSPGSLAESRSAHRRGARDSRRVDRRFRRRLARFRRRLAGNQADHRRDWPTEGDPEFGISRGRLLPQHRILGDDAVSPETREKLKNSLVLVHGGMAQNVGPILEMVTEKYLLRGERNGAAGRRRWACSTK